ncbi:MAG: DNA ligase [archaeon]
MSKESRLKKLKRELEDIKLSNAEEKTLEWLAGWEQETIDNLLSMFKKLKKIER